MNREQFLLMIAIPGFVVIYYLFNLHILNQCFRYFSFLESAIQGKWHLDLFGRVRIDGNHKGRQISCFVFLRQDLSYTAVFRMKLSDRASKEVTKVFYSYIDSSTALMHGWVERNYYDWISVLSKSGSLCEFDSLVELCEKIENTNFERKY